MSLSDPSSCTILVVDDSVDTREAIAVGLRIYGFTVQEAGNGVEALEQLSQHHCDVLLTDLWMPEMGGAELILNARSQPETAKMPIILMTAAHSEGLAASTQADGLLKKPFQFQTLLRMLARNHCRPSIPPARPIAA